MTNAQCLLGAILLGGNETLTSVRDKISDDCFDNELDKTIYSVICEIADNDEPIDIMLISRKVGERIGKQDSYLRDLLHQTPSAANAELYANELVIESTGQKLSSAALSASMEITTGSSVLETALKLRSECDSLIEKIANGGMITGTDALLNFWRYRNMLESGERTATVKTDFRKLDELLGGGLVNEGFYILAARPGNGKTTIALNIAEQVSNFNNPVLFISLEMSIDQITAKRIAIESGMSSTFLLNSTDKSSHKTWEKINDASETLSKRPLFLNKAKSATIADVEKLASQISGLKIVIIDYLGLMQHTEGKNLYEKVTATSAALKRLARTLGIPVLCLAQLNREVEGRGGNGEPRMSDLRDSGSIEQDADGVILLHRQHVENLEKYAPVPLKMIVAKNRHGETGSLYFDFYLTNGRIREQ